ncbi:FG-GAP-like repeat-containing protein [Streptomyces sp. NPDC001744]|uniref:FG-GAP repeat domain-containing protein n=1 Tax=Streptomyces sp. NPDC001744 TaxID=3364606 RepID=UPI0036989AFB
MKKRFGVVGTAALCALLGLQTGSGSASEMAGGEVPAAAPSTTGTSGGPTGFPYVGSAAAQRDGTGVSTVRAVPRGPRHDYNGDGRSDMAAWYDYAGGDDGMRAFLAGADGGFAAPNRAWQSPAGNFWAEHMKRVTGDFNGDGKGDVAAFYGYDDGRVSLLTWLGTGDGTFAAHFASWAVAPGNWTFDAITAEAGDFNGDGRDDIAAWYDYADGHDALIGFSLDATGKLGNRRELLNAVPGWYERSQMRPVTGDYNGDGRDDLATFYGYSDTRAKAITFVAKADGTLGDALHSWSEPKGWSLARVHMFERYSSPPAPARLPGRLRARRLPHRGERLAARPDPSAEPPEGPRGAEELGSGRRGGRPPAHQGRHQGRDVAQQHDQGPHGTECQDHGHLVGHRLRPAEGPHDRPGTVRRRDRVHLPRMARQRQGPEHGRLRGAQGRGRAVAAQHQRVHP